MESSFTATLPRPTNVGRNAPEPGRHLHNAIRVAAVAPLPHQVQNLTARPTAHLEAYLFDRV